MLKPTTYILRSSISICAWSVIDFKFSCFSCSSRSVILCWGAPDIHWPDYVTMIVADPLGPNRGQAISSHHAYSNIITMLHQCIMQHAYLQLSLTHWGPVTHICVSDLAIIGSHNGLSPGRRQAIIWTNTGILLVQILETNSSEIFSKIHTFSFKKMHLNMSSGKWQPFCLGLNVLSKLHIYL